jgi:aspartate kinase
MIISKFGGTSVADAAAIIRTTEIVRGRLDRKPIVVVSALAGVTNALLAIARQASEGNFISAVSSVQALRDRHLAEVDALLHGSPEHGEIGSEISVIFDELASLCEALSVLGFITARSLDAIAGMGERASSMLVAAAFRHRGIAAVHVDARKVMITDANYGKAEPQAEAIALAARTHIAPLVHDGKVPVMGGYIGSSTDGVTTTLGRGGSDYSASLIGAGLQAGSIEIWTDVDGMLTADPRIVPQARPIEQIRFDEASELASFGAKVLHPATIAPAVRLGIPVWIYNSRNPSAHGTRITFSAPRRSVTAIAAKRDTTIIRVATGRMLFQHGFLRRVFDLFDQHSVSVDVVATSEVSVSVTVDDQAPLDVLLGALRQIGDVSIERRRAIISVVGSGIADDADAMGTVLRALGHRRIHMLSLSASAINLTILLDDADVPDAMQALHTALFERADA